MTILDFAILGTVMGMIVAGLFLGLVRIMMPLAICGAVFIASRFYSDVADLIQDFIKDPRLSKIIGFIFVAIGVYLILVLLAKLLLGIMEAGMIDWVNHLLGGLIGAVLSCMVMAFLVLFLEKHGGKELEKLLDKSLLAPALLDLLVYLKGLV